jgi:hypothetical protein
MSLGRFFRRHLGIFASIDEHCAAFAAEMRRNSDGRSLGRVSESRAGRRRAAFAHASPVPLPGGHRCADDLHRVAAAGHLRQWREGQHEENAQCWIGSTSSAMAPNLSTNFIDRELTALAERKAAAA